MSSFKVRTKWTIILLVSFIFIIALGHTYCSLLVFFVLIMLFKELLELKRNIEREKIIPNFYKISWYFFFLTVTYLFPKFLPQGTYLYHTSDNVTSFVQWKSPLFVYVAIVIGILIFTLSLEKKWYWYQFKQLAWTILTLIVVVA